MTWHSSLSPSGWWWVLVDSSVLVVSLVFNGVPESKKKFKKLVNPTKKERKKQRLTSLRPSTCVCPAVVVTPWHCRSISLSSSEMAIIV